MCGIAGYLQRGSEPRVIDRMLDRIAHRGPDGSGTMTLTSGDWRAELGHRRLAIIDLVTGDQPMKSADDGDLAIVFNGEIYNFAELRSDLEKRGRTFRTQSDTEALLQHLGEHGAAGLDAVNGMFAFALWDGKHRRLLLARDRAGIKPLFYAPLRDGGVAFASELGPILQHPDVDRTPSEQGYLSYFFSDYFQPPHTAVRGAFQLPPGHYLVWENGKLGEPVPFFKLHAPTRPHGSDRELADETWKKLEASVDRQLIADVPVGIFLSGGLDSSSVAVLAARHAKNRMKAFSIAFEDPTFDESDYARRVATSVGVDFISETLRESDLIDITEEALATLDEPLADASYLPTYLLSRLASRHVKVVVGGDGGDELFGGYPTYKAHRYARIYRKFPAFLRSNLLPRAINRLPVRDHYQSLEWKLKRFAGRWDDDAAVLHQRWLSNVDLPDLKKLLPKSHGLPQTLMTQLPHFDSEIERVMALDFSTYMSGSVLTKVDRAAMAHGLEVRPPILDNEMIDWAFSLPARFKVRGETTKYIFKMAARGHVPDDIIDRPKKGFGIPIAAWLRGPLRSRLGDIFSKSPVWDTGLVDKTLFTEWRDDHLEKRADRSKPLWSLLVMDRWLRRSGSDD